MIQLFFNSVDAGISEIPNALSIIQFVLNTADADVFGVPLCSCIMELSIGQNLGNLFCSL